VILFTCLLWLAAAAMTWWALMRHSAAPPAPEGPAADPHAGTVAQFMREVHDWDRRG
jgi:hypothetical protein